MARAPMRVAAYVKPVSLRVESIIVGFPLMGC
jgi:hypothetical protein